jgi:hypothetical protein
MRIKSLTYRGNPILGFEEEGLPGAMKSQLRIAQRSPQGGIVDNLLDYFLSFFPAHTQPRMRNF